MKTLRAICVLIPLFSAVCCLFGQEAPDGKKLDAILEELRQIHKLLGNRPNTPSVAPLRTARIEVGKAPLLGSKDAPFTLVEFTDFQCKFCQQFYNNTFKDLKKLYVDTGKLRFYSIDLPLAEIHPAALLAAQAGHCAAEQEHFWPIYDKMKSNSNDLEATTLIRYAQEAGLDVVAFQECLKSERYKKDVEADVLNAKNKGVLGTPSFVIGKSADFGVEGEMLMGALPLDAFKNKLKDIGLDK
jgi:protein-disulfide isomerase